MTPGPFPIGLLAAGGGIDPLVRDIGLCMVFAGVLTVVFARFRIPSIAALLLAGVLLGPYTPGVVVDLDNISTIANLGLVLLLFLIGLEIDLRKILSQGRLLLVTGLLQFPLCVGMGWGAAWLAARAGLSGLEQGYAALYVGLVCGASSTLLVVRLLQERYQMDTASGRVAVGLLILQDVWAIVVLAAQPNFQSPQVGTILAGFAGIAVLGGIAYALARWVLPVPLHWIARSPELLLVAGAGWCFGIGLLGTHLDAIAGAVGIHAHVAVSLEMGALIAGACLASHPFSHHVVAKVGVVHDFFITLFFVALGVGIPRPEGSTALVLAAFMAAVAVTARYVVFLPLLYFNGMDRRNAMLTSTRLAQISEFCLVIAYLGHGLGHVGGEFVSAVIFAFVMTALATPLLFDAGDRIHHALGGFLTLVGMRTPAHPPEEEKAEEPADVVFLGLHRVASSLLHEIEKAHPTLIRKVLVVDINAATHAEIRRRGARAVYGDIANAESLRMAGVDRARVAICTIPDDLLRGITNLQLVKTLRSFAPGLVIISNTTRLADVRGLYAAGADLVFLRRVEAAKSLLPAVMTALQGGIAEYRRGQEEILGRVEDRDEVMP